MLIILDPPDTSLVGGYALLIAASGLWSSVRLVWFTTALAMGCYLSLAVQARQTPSAEHFRFANAFLAVLAVTGLVIARQVRRIRSLSSYYEQRAIG